MTKKKSYIETFYIKDRVSESGLQGSSFQMPIVFTFERPVIGGVHFYDVVSGMFRHHVGKCRFTETCNKTTTLKVKLPRVSFYRDLQQNNNNKGYANTWAVLPRPETKQQQ